MGSLRCCNVICLFSHKILTHSRHFNTSVSQLAVKNISISKQGKVLNKLLGSSKKKRKFFFDDFQIPSSEKKLSLGNHIKNNKENSRRIAVLNSLFMKHISDLLVTGDVGVDVMSKGLEISRVSMNPDFCQLNVFWGCNSENNIIDLEKILPNVGYTLRHQLSQLKVMGVVPRIIFIKDKHYADAAKVDYLLRIADYGEDHVSSNLKSDFNAEPLVESDIEKLPSNDQTSGESSVLEDEEVMPPMRQDVFSLDHQLIMNKILKKMQRSRALHRYEPNLMIKCDGNINTSSNIPGSEIMTKEERKQALAKFVLSRRILQEKRMKDKHKADKEIDTAKELDDEVVEDEYLKVEDYLEEDFEEKKFQN